MDAEPTGPRPFKVITVQSTVDVSGWLRRAAIGVSGGVSRAAQPVAHTVPLTVNLVGLVFVPEKLAWKPKLTVPPAAIVLL